MITILTALVSLLSFRVRSRVHLELELIALRHQMSVLRRQRPGRLRLFSTDWLLWVWLYRIWPQVLNAMCQSGAVDLLRWFAKLDRDDRGRIASILFQPIGGFSQSFSCIFFSFIFSGVRLHGGKQVFQRSRWLRDCFFSCCH